MTARRVPTPAAVAVGAVVLAAVIVVLGLSLGTDPLGRTAPVPARARAVAEPGADATLDLAAALPETASALAGEWAPGPGGATVETAPPASGLPLLTIPLDGPPWATATVEGSAVEGWSVAFGIDGPSSYWAATLHPAVGTVELVRVAQGQASTLATRPLAAGAGTGDAGVQAVVRWQGRQVQVELAGARLPTVTVPVGVAPAVGLLGRGAAAQPGGARWSSVTIVAESPLADALLPPLLGARHVTADEARQGLGG
ncbi:MAG TPA: hypothetical protein VK507_13970 [Iamia sp.]|nr:hypothetical protein [Iamia sp.]